ncbi:copper amine oxidase N-terminal domain-containing protein [Tindallia californiensis]|uniref:Copper amine oxidase N-terminal domain-containing protein n=1 Tax=Tindallia californiensis TaxID=159292 RepID=A0A1H3R7G9_9FIRM|nr:copper amine oxidase N-terminal domain-containing protein [Tindallia californiensis]SDZ21453.1 Copper amine oxidase N-terminal domain-containing protein [Tindallia californiensis]
MKLFAAKKNRSTAILVALLVALLPLVAFADEATSEEKELLAFQQIDGYVKEMTEDADADSAFLRMEDQEGNPFDLHLTEETIAITDELPKEGDSVIAYYDNRKPMITIYPPQYHAVVFMVSSDHQQLFVGEFDEHLIDSTNYLRLIMQEDTMVIDHQHQVYEGPLEGKTLAVLYGAATKSIPAQTSPNLVVVLPEENETKDTDEPERYQPDVTSMDLIVKGERLDAPSAWMTEEEVVMLPVAAIAEKIGFNVMWSEELQTVMLSDSITLTIGEDAYVNMKYDEPITLGQAPVVRDGRSFVPLSFFRKVIPMNNAYVFENQILIDNEDPME